MVLITDLIRRIQQAHDAYNALKGMQGWYGLSTAEYEFALNRLGYERDQFKALLKRETRKMMDEANVQAPPETETSASESEEQPKKRKRKTNGE
jgi:hypothetical protein